MAARAARTRSMDESTRLEKNRRIAQSQKETRERRKNKDILVRTVKIQRNKLSRAQLEALERLFLEGKWLYNTALAHGQFDEEFRRSLDNTVEVKLPTGEIERRQLTVLGGQMQQGILARMRDNLKGLKVLKDHGRKIGGLRFISEMASIPLKQFGGTHKIRGSKVKVSNVPGWMRANGLNQYSMGHDDFANAVLIKRGHNFFVAFTVYREKSAHSSLATKKFVPDTTIGLDMGILTHITFSDGSAVNARVEEPDRLKRLSRKLSRQQKGSKAFAETKRHIGEEHEKAVNRRNDAANKVASWILGHEHVFMQDENVSSWKRRSSVARGSRAIQYGILGGVKAKLIGHPRVTVLKGNVATAATCVCGVKTLHDLSQRKFECPSCGYSAPRDIHAARNMFLLATPGNIKINGYGT